MTGPVAVTEAGRVQGHEALEWVHAILFVESVHIIGANKTTMGIKHAPYNTDTAKNT